jgi:hypothetical protein
MLPSTNLHKHPSPRQAQGGLSPVHSTSWKRNSPEVRRYQVTTACHESTPQRERCSPAWDPWFPERPALSVFYALEVRRLLPRTSEKTSSRDCLETLNGPYFLVPQACTTVRKGTLLGASRCQETCHLTRPCTFQTVSRRGILRSWTSTLRSSPKFAKKISKNRMMADAPVYARRARGNGRASIPCAERR